MSEHDEIIRRLDRIIRLLEQLTTPAPASTADTSSDCVTVRPEAAQQMSGLGRTTMYRLLAEGRIRSVKVGRARLVDVASLRAYLDNGDAE